MVTNWGASIFNALSNAVNLILTFIPRVIGFLVILIVGLIVATLVSKAVTFLLRKVGFDRMANRIGLSRFEQRMGVSMEPAGLLGKIVYWFLILIFLVPATDALGLPSVSNILNTLVAYIPNVFVAILVLFLGTLAATFVADLVRGATATANVGNPSIFANVARWSIIGFAALVALEQLQIAPTLINELFGAMVLAMAIAFGLAFGLGGQDTARRWLARGENTVSSAASQISAQQSANEMNAAQMQTPPTQVPQTPAYQQPYTPQQQPYQAQQAYPTQQQPYAPQQPVPPQYTDNTEPTPPYTNRPNQR
jgi:flagellar biosynthesis protein FliQ